MAMEENNIPSQIDSMNQKLDLLIEYVNTERLKRQVFDDLTQDLSRVGTELFKSSVVELENQGIELDMEEVKSLLFKLLKNIQTFNSLLGMLQSATDFAKDVAPIAREVIIDLTYELNRLNENGTFEAMKSIGKNISNPVFLNNVATVTEFLSTQKIDEKTDNKSLFKLFKELRSKEVRMGLSYTLRLVRALSSGTAKKETNILK